MCAHRAPLYPKRQKKSSTDPAAAFLPELARDVTKSRITAKVIWASLILRLTFHLIWVSMTAADVHGAWIHFATWSKLIRLATTQDNKSQKSQRKREKGEGGAFRYFSSSHKGLLVWVTPAIDGQTPRLPHFSPLCASEPPCTAAPPIRSVAPSRSRHVEPPSRQHRKSLSPPQAVSHSADRRLRQIRGAHTSEPAPLLAGGGTKS